MPPQNSRSHLDTPNLVAENVIALTALQTEAERGVTRHQRFIEALTANLGRPAALYTMLVLIFVWMLYNSLAPHLHLRVLDPPPFYWLQGAITFLALVVTIMILITQNRQAALAEQRSHLDMQINLLSEQKIAKLIALIEELRSDLPNVRDRRDPEAEAMKEAADPHEVLMELEKTIDTLAQIDQRKPL